MQFFMRPLYVTFFFTFVFLNCKGQTNTKPNSKEYAFPQVGWRIDVPSSFTVMDSAQIEAMTNKGISAIENTYDTTLDFRATKTLISITKGQYNFLSSTITLFDPKQDGDWSEVNSLLKNVIVETFQSQAPAMKIDTSSSVEKIGGIEFQKFHVVTTYPNKMVMNTFMYSRLHKGFDYGINISYTDEKIGKELMAILATSKFDNVPRSEGKTSTKATLKEALVIYQNMTNEICNCTSSSMRNKKPSTTLDSCYNVVIAKYADTLRTIGYDTASSFGKKMLVNEIKFINCGYVFSLMQKEWSDEEAKKQLFKGEFLWQKKLSNDEYEIVCRDNQTKEQKIFKSKKPFNENIVKDYLPGYELTIEYEIVKNPKTNKVETFIKENGILGIVGAVPVTNQK